MSKPREFFLVWTPVKYMPNFGVWDVKLDDVPVHVVNQEKIHVIEYSALEAERARSQKLLEALDYSFCMGALNHQLSEAQCRGNLFKISENSREAIETYKKEPQEQE